eukprot:CAMPEP_0117491184 /NCGR_PEP_ID=MMETSP0784-20121206/17934_1 /TAXON_ID=39447 /ORGANISM="" /LENGTH=164 /DNA_ID=CAMNT_0005285963 /DNA_START=61 /DNA_END=552 /DNA_ORIENTATION=-
MAFLVVAPLSALLLMSGGPHLGASLIQLVNEPDGSMLGIRFDGGIDHALSDTSAKEDEGVSSADPNQTEHESAADVVRVVKNVPPSSDAQFLVQVFAEPSTSAPIAYTLGWSIAAVVLLGMAAMIARGQPGDEGKPSQFSIHVAEFLGTFMLVFSVGCNVLVGD